MIPPDQFSGFLAALSSRQPTPGGGAAAAVVLATAYATAAMAIRYSTKKADPPEFSQRMNDLAQQIDGLREQVLLIASADQNAYDTWQATQKLPPDDPARLAAERESLLLPLQVLEYSQHLVLLLIQFQPDCNPRLFSDLAVALHLACGAGRAAARIAAEGAAHASVEQREHAHAMLNSLSNLEAALAPNSWLNTAH